MTLTAPAPSGGVVVTLAADSPSVRVPASVAIATGDTSGKFQVTTTAVTTAVYVTLTARVGDVTKTVTIELRVDPNTVPPTSPTPPPPPPPPPSSVTISFRDLRVSGAPVTRYSESGFTVAAQAAEWVASLTYGKPAPFTLFYSPEGVETLGELKITADGARFWLTSVDLYSSTTRIPYTLEGVLRNRVVYTVADTLGNTFGNFATVTNPHEGVPIDELIIRLRNPAAPCCRNPMGLDNIVLRK